MQTLAADYAKVPSSISKILGFLVLAGLTGRRRKTGRRTRPDDCRPVCGGYNEAFVIQYWAGYNPRH